MLLNCGEFPKILKSFGLKILLSGLLFFCHLSTYSQQAKISINIENETLLELFNQIESKTTYKFFYKSKTVNEQEKIQLHAVNWTLEEILDSVLNKQNLVYELVNNNIVIKPSAIVRSITEGQVIDIKTNKSLEGVEIFLSDSSNYYKTDENGKFRIEGLKKGTSLKFFLPGYLLKDTVLSSINSIISLIPDATVLDEIVVVGYGVIRKKDLTGSISSIKPNDIQVFGATNPSQLIQGKLPGVRVVSNNGEPGSGADITVRGVSSLLKRMQPLFVVDGIPLDGRSTTPDGITSAPATSPLNFLNPEDIESIDVLKDASAAAIYGSRGAAGVIIITTKKGKEGKNEISYSTNFRVSTLPFKLNVLTADEWRKFRKDPRNGLNLTTDYSDYGASTDWQDLIFRKAYSHEHNLVLSGGNQKTTYRTSMNYLKNNGIIKNSDLTKYVGRINVSQKGLKDKLLVETNMNLSEVVENRVPVGLTGSEGDLLMNALISNPTVPVKDSLDMPIQTIGSERFPTTLLTYYHDLTRTANLMGGTSASLQIFKNITLKSSLGFFYSNARRLINQSEKLIYLNPSTRNSQINEVEMYNYIAENTLNYKLEKGMSNLILLAGYSFHNFNHFTSNMYGGGFATDGFMYSDNIGSSSSQQIASSTDNYKMQSFYTRMNYSFKNKYMFTATMRRDGSTKFGSKRKYGDFPSFSVAWRLNEEKFLKDAVIINNLKLRLSWGLTGNSDIGTRNTQATFRLTPENIALIGNKAIPGIALVRTSNSVLQWESTEAYNAGIDFGILRGKISGSIDIYNKTSKNLLLEVPSPAGSPTSKVVMNLDSTKIINHGLEIGLLIVPFSGKNFEWEISGNFTTVQNILRHLPVAQYITGTTQGPGLQGVYLQVIKNNTSIGQFQGNKISYVGDDGKINYVKTWNGLKDSVMLLGSALPEFTFSIGNKIRYKSFDLNIFIDAVYGNKIYNSTAMIADKTSIRTARNALQYFVDDNTSIFQRRTQVSDRYVEDGSYLRFSNVTLGYNFNSGKNKFISSYRIYFACSNLFLITKYKGYDPDINSDRSNGSIKSYGIDLTSYPKARTYGLGLNLQF